MTMATRTAVLVTGARGLVGAAVVRRLLERGDVTTVYSLSRTPAALVNDGVTRPRVVPVRGDITRPGLALELASRRELRSEVDVVIHAAAETRFSQSWSEASLSNVVGTSNVLELASSWPTRPRVCFVSTAFVAGRRIGPIPESVADGAEGWVNEYERSKHEAERLVRVSGLPHVICRPSTIVCDTPAGGISQFNAAHGALRVCARGLVPLLPGTNDTLVDVVPCDYVSRALTDLALDRDADGVTYHLASGADAMPLGELLDRTYAHWATLAERPGALVRPVLTDLETYRLFEATVLETAEPGLRRIARALSHFVPQLAHAKTFETARADAALGYRPPPPRTYWTNMLRALGAWRPEAEAAPRTRSVA
jgi:nucleoside-diphosphate-sugar epimerase